MRAGQTPRIPHLLATLVLVAGLAMFATSSANATGPLWGSTYPSKITNKLGNGLGNIFFCWAEVPYELNHEIQNTDPLTGSVTGFGQGIYYTGQRLVLGVVDVFTFPFDLYDNNYQSVQRTKFPFIDEAE
jgi:putative exosortase-associated protein (TIGR04073 family)